MTVPVLDKAAVLKKVVVFDSASVTAAWGSSALSKIPLYSLDKEYRALPKSVWDEILETHLSLHPYETDFYDCDGFSAVFMGKVLENYDVNGLARVIDVSGHHSYNAVLVCDDGKSCSWLKVEPQTDAFVDSPPRGVKFTVPSGTYAATAGIALTA